MRTKWWHNGPVGGITVPVYSGAGAILQAATVESADEICLLLNGPANVVEHMQDTLERIATEWPSVGASCDCDSGSACSVCEIDFLLKEWKAPDEVHA